MKNIILLTASLHPCIGIEWLKKINFSINLFGFDNIHLLFEYMKLKYKRFPAYSQATITEAQRYAERILNITLQNNINIITGRNDYPVIYIKGIHSKMNNNKKCGIVGTRHPSEKTLNATKEAAYILAQNNICIVSGLASGCDTAAHIGGISGFGGTIAVLPTGLLNIYPYENKELAERITENGLLLSIFPPDASIQKYRAIVRNNLIADISDPLILTESSISGGSKYAVNRTIKNKGTIFTFNNDTTDENCSLNELLLKNEYSQLYSYEKIDLYYKNKLGLNDL